MAAKKKHVDFEKALQDLEALVEQMESGELTLEESLESFEKGVKLTRDCQKLLTEAQQRVDILLEKNGEPGLEPFVEDEE